jgi:hypothetical protein
MVRVEERQGYRGSFRVKVWKQGSVIRDYQKHNLIVDGAKGIMARLVGGDIDGHFVSKIACGTSAAEADPEDTAITGAFAKDVEDISFPEPDQVQFDLHIGADENNGDVINEFGLLTEDDTLFARIVMDEPINKTHQISLDVEWVIVFDNKEEEGNGEPE